MSKAARILFVCACLLLLVITASAQSRRQTSESEISGLINTLEAEHEFAVLEASRKLVKLGPGVITPLIERLKQNKNCNFQFYAAETIRKIDPSRELVKSTLIDVARGNCAISPNMHAGLVFFSATSALIQKVRGGIPLVAQWLSDEDKSIRPQAAIAFDSIAELIQQKRLPRARAVEIIDETSAAIPMLAKALSDEEQVVRCRSYAALWRMQQSGYRKLSSAAGRALEGVPDRCL